MTKAELRQEITDTVVRLLGAEFESDEEIGGVKTYQQHVLFTGDDNHAKKGTCSYYVVDEGTQDEVAYYLKRQQNYVAPTPAPSKIVAAKAKLDASLGDGNWTYRDFRASSDGTVARIWAKTGNTGNLPAGLYAVTMDADGELLVVPAED